MRVYLIYLKNAVYVRVGSVDPGHNRSTKCPCQIGTITVPVKSLLPFFVSQNHGLRTTYVSKINCCFFFYLIRQHRPRPKSETGNFDRVGKVSPLYI